MRKNYESPLAEIEKFTLADTVLTFSSGQIEENGEDVVLGEDE